MLEHIYVSVYRVRLLNYMYGLINIAIIINCITSYIHILYIIYGHCNVDILNAFLSKLNHDTVCLSDFEHSHL